MTRFTPRTPTSLTWIVAVMAGLVLTAGRAGLAQDTEARTIYAIVLDDANTPVTDLEPEEVTVVESMHTRRAIVTVDFDSVRRGGGGAAGRDAKLDWATETSVAFG